MSVPYIFKLLDLSDLPEMMQIERSSFDNPWSAQVMRDSLAALHTRSFGLFLNAEMLGYVVLSIVMDEAEILSMAISKNHQGQGYGKALLRYGIEQAVALGAKTLYLEVRANHPVAVSLYKKLGFVQIGKRPNYYPNVHTGGSDDALLMRLSTAEGFSDEEGQQKRSAEGDRK
jgi:[ribosomal protein S18]-alanine N-acetyltransferase